MEGWREKRVEKEGTLIGEGGIEREMKEGSEARSSTSLNSP